MAVFISRKDKLVIRPGRSAPASPAAPAATPGGERPRCEQSRCKVGFPRGRARDQLIARGVSPWVGASLELTFGRVCFLGVLGGVVLRFGPRKISIPMV